MLKVYCKTYYEAAVKILKEFDTSAANDLSTAQTFLKTVRILHNSIECSFTCFKLLAYKVFFYYNLPH